MDGDTALKWLKIKTRLAIKKKKEIITKVHEQHQFGSSKSKCPFFST